MATLQLQENLLLSEQGCRLYGLPSRLNLFRHSFAWYLSGILDPHLKRVFMLELYKVSDAALVSVPIRRPYGELATHMSILSVWCGYRTSPDGRSFHVKDKGCPNGFGPQRHLFPPKRIRQNRKKWSHPPVKADGDWKLRSGRLSMRSEQQTWDFEFRHKERFQEVIRRKGGATKVDSPHSCYILRQLESG